MAVLHQMFGPDSGREPVLASYRGTATRHPREYLGRLASAITPCAKSRVSDSIWLQIGVFYGMAYIEDHARDQALLLPASVEDYVSADNPVRFIDAFIDDLDLGDAGFLRSRPKTTGRPGFDPGDMLKLYLYGYLNRVRSSRRLEAEAVRNLEVIWLVRGLRPDFKTIALSYQWSVSSHQGNRSRRPLPKQGDD